MAVDKSQMGLIFSGSPSRATQENELRAAGAQHLVDLTAKAKHTWRDAVRLCRPGDQVYIYALVLVPLPRGADELPPTAQVIAFLSEIAERKAVLIEVYTGRRSDDLRAKRAMISDAVAALKSGGRDKMPAGFRKAGRIPVKWSPVQLQRARDAWFSRDYATNEIAERHMPSVEVDGKLVGFGSTRARRLWGPNGRPWPAKRRAR